MQDSRSQILDKIKQALSTSVPAPFTEPVQDSRELFKPRPEELEIAFAENFTALQGHFSFCLDMQEMAARLSELTMARKFTKWYCTDEALKAALAKAGFAPAWHANLADCHASITRAEALVARTGSLLLSAALAGGRTASVYAPVHVCIGFTRQLVWDIADALELMQRKYGNNLPSFITLASGPSRTADIEKTLVTGVHGPKEVFCLLADSE